MTDQHLGDSNPFRWSPDVLRGKSPFEPRAAVTYLLLAIQGSLIAMMATALGFTYRGEGINEVLLVFAGTLAICGILRWRGLTSLSAAAEAAVLLTLTSMAAGLQCALLSSIRLPYRDPLLSSADRLLFPFLDWSSIATTLAGQAELVRPMSAIYSSLLWQPHLLLFILAFTGRDKKLWRFVRAWALALVATIAIFGVMPAVTPYVYYGFTQEDLPNLTVNTAWRPAQIIADLRSGALRELGVANLAGLVTFPSFHSAGAVLLAWGFRGLPVIGPVFLALNVAMILTVPVVGSHYFVDVLGGVAVAALAIWASRHQQ